MDRGVQYRKVYRVAIGVDLADDNWMDGEKKEKAIERGAVIANNRITSD